jgi:phosphatidylglycerol:prolipoprotein diacylglycerol transferase
MHPVIVHIAGPFAVYSYGLCLAVAIFVGLFVFYLRARRVIDRPEKIVNVYIIVILCGIVGSWVLFIVANRAYYASLPPKMIHVLGRPLAVPDVLQYVKAGLVWYGGVIGALGGGLAYGLLARLPILATMDAAAPALALAHAWGRTGCFLAGCCYGRVCDAGAALCARFPEGSVAYADMLEKGAIAPGAAETPPLVPVQLVEAGFELTMALLLMALVGRRWRRGHVMAAYFILYGVFRFFLENLRSDPYRGAFLFFSTSQWIAILMVLAGAAIIALAGVRAGRRAAR